MKILQNKIKELEATEDTNSDEYWKGVVVGLNMANKLLNDKRSKDTKKTKEAEKCVDNFIKKNGYPPTYQQVADLLNLASTNTAYHRLRNCRQKMISN